MTASPAQMLALMEPEQREAHLRLMTEDAVSEMRRSWRFWARPEQTAPDWLWRWWVMVTGRGFGKNRSQAEWIVDRCEQFAAHEWRHTVGLFNRTFGHVKALQINGESGLVPVCERRGHTLHHASTSQEATLTVRLPGLKPHTSLIEIHTADDPDRARGRNLHTAGADEVAAWRQKRDSEGGTTFTNLDFALRSPCPPGLQPQGMVTTTPRPIPLIRDLINGDYGPTAVTRGSMFDNRANLAPEFIRSILRTYGGTRLGAQEIEGLVLEDVFGALWTYALIQRSRIEEDEREPLDRVAIGVDPPGGIVTDCGIVVAGRRSAVPINRLRHAEVLEDLSHPGPPEKWAKTVVSAWRRYRDLGYRTEVVAERNFGEEMVRAVIHNVDPACPVKGVRASESKKARAEPITLMYDQDRIHHVGVLPGLEEELTTWVPPGTVDEYGVDRGSTESPNRLDAHVWALTHLLPPAGTTAATGTSPNNVQAKRPPTARPSATFRPFGSR